MRRRTAIQNPDLNAVREEARRHALLLLSEGYRKGEDRRDWTIVVHDETGAVALDLSVREAIL